MGAMLTKHATPAPRLLANALRRLAMDATERANSSHPGMPMGWHRYLRYNPPDPRWPGRDQTARLPLRNRRRLRSSRLQHVNSAPRAFSCDSG
jgi:hypothetical protein